MRDVEIYPDGYDLANFLAEHLWEDAVDIYGERRSYGTPLAKAYHMTVEALRSPESDLDDDTRESLIEPCQNGRPSTASSEEADPAPHASDARETTQSVVFPEVRKDARPKKKRRRLESELDHKPISASEHNDQKQ